MSLGDGQGVVSGYVHGAVGPGMGKNAALVALRVGESVARDLILPLDAISLIFVCCRRHGRR